MEIKHNDIVRCVRKGEGYEYDNVCIMNSEGYRFYDLRHNAMHGQQFDGEAHRTPMEMLKIWNKNWKFFLVGKYSESKVERFAPIPIVVEGRKIVKRVIRD